MIATDMTSSGDPEEKLRWAFRMYDKDGSGEIDVDEMVDIFSLMYTVQVIQRRGTKFCFLVTPESV